MQPCKQSQKFSFYSIQFSRQIQVQYCKQRKRLNELVAILQILIKNLINKFVNNKKEINKKLITIEYMNNSNIFVPTMSSNNTTPIRNQRLRRFSRKPGQSSERSSSKKSNVDSIKEMYIKSPAAVKRQNKQQDFFTTLASSIIKINEQSDKKREKIKYKIQFQDKINVHQFQESQAAIKKLNNRLENLQTQLELRNHETSILSSQCQRLKKQVEEQKQKRRKFENQKKQISKELKQVQKSSQSLKNDIKKIEKQRQCLLKQIQFFQRINYDDKTRSMQSYRELYLEQQLQKIRNQFHKSRGEREIDLQNHIKTLNQQKYTIESHMKAIKLANECLVKQINTIQDNLHDFVLNSDEYKKLRDKYVRFLEQYKTLRNQYWTLKAQVNKKKGKSYDESDIFSMSASEVQNDLSVLKSSSVNQNSNNNNNSILHFLSIPNGSLPPKPPQSKQKQK